MTDATIARATRRQVEREGESIDLINYAEGTESEHGETRGAKTTVTTQAIISPPRGQRDAEFSGVADVDVDVEITVPDTVSGIVDGAGTLASKIDRDQDGNAEYIVAVKTDQQNGSLLLQCSEVGGE